MPSIVAYLIVAGVAAAVTFAMTPIAQRISERVGGVVAPDDRRVHLIATPTGGGIAMMLGLVAGLGAAFALGGFNQITGATTEIIGVLAAATIIFGVGLIDDLRDISPPAKVAGMVLAGSVLSLTGVSVLVFRVPFFDTLLLSADWSALVTVVWVLLMANAINLIDGLDGLAAGIVAIAAGTFALYSLRLADEGVIGLDNPGTMWAVITLGICLGFLPHNVHPARIFMGDSGALLLGLMMAVGTMSVGGRVNDTYSGQSFFFYAPILIPLVILGVPILDSVFAIVRRAARRSSVAGADKEHLHHRLMKLGHGHRRSVLILWGWTALLSAFVLYPTYTGEGDAVVPIGIAALALVLYTVLHPRLGEAGDNTIAEDELRRLDS